MAMENGKENIMALHVDTHDRVDSTVGDLGSRPLSRGRLLGLGAAGMAAAFTPLGRAFAAWEGSLPKALHGTVSFCQWLYEGNGKYDVSPEKEPTRLYQQYLHMHPGVRLQWVQEPNGNNWNAWFLTRAIANRLPDLLGFPNSGWPSIQKGFLVPITKYLLEPNPYIPGNKRWIDSFPKGFLEPFQGTDGNYYGISGDANATWIYYNPEHLTRIGMKPPATWAELMEACAKLKEKGITPYSHQGGVGFYNTNWFNFAESSLWASEFAAGTSLSIPDWVRAVKKGLLKHTDARSRAAWQLVKEFSTYWQRGAVSGAGPALYKNFADGKFTFMYDGSWTIGTLQPLLKGRFPLSVLPVGFPPITKVTSPFANGSLQSGGLGGLSGSQLWTTKHAADHLDVVVDFLRYFSAPQVIGPMAIEVGSAPMVKGVQKVPPLIAQSVQIASQPGLLWLSENGADPTYTTTYDKMAEGYLAGALTLDTALSQLEAVQQQVADRLAAQLHI
jgi:ABC-type glycerol-3-phosphate transport system substrate-binding protein